MEKILETLKSLYRGENIVNKHLIYASLFILPTLAGSVKGYIDKDMPTTLKAILILITLVFAIIAIVPALMLSGYALKFMSERHAGSTESIPEVEPLNLLKMGFKAIPLYVVWSIYSLILFLILSGVASLPMFASGFNLAGILLSILLYIAIVIIMVILTPFFSYIFIEYTKDFQYKKYLFNPMRLVEYIKKSFKPTIMIAIKYALVTIITCLGLLGIYLIFLLVIVIVGLVFTIILPKVTTFEYHPAYITIFVLLSTICGIIQSYISAVVALGYSANLIEVYKEEIEE